jgi:ABC-type antimicrobial peptide transport system permease subunit
MAVSALRRNVMRSSLTTLGIIIGVAAVIAMVELGQGSKTAIARSIEAMGANNLTVYPGQAASGGVSFGSGSARTLTPGDAEAIARYCYPAVAAAAPVVRARTQLVYGNRNWVPMFLYGTTPAYLDVREWEVVEGRMFTEQEVTSAANVCVLGATVVRELFGEDDPLEEMLRINNQPVKIIGVLERKGSSVMGMDQDDVVILPWTTVKTRISANSAETANQSAAERVDTSTPAFTSGKRYPNDGTGIYPQRSAAQMLNYPASRLPPTIDQIQVRAADEKGVAEATRQITALLRERHRIRPGQPDDFYVRDMAEMSKAMGSNSRLMGTLLLAVATISLVVGGVGIMNIMLVSVTERTKEIGLRMAVGARGRDVLRQFLTEAVLLCLLGGAIGILLGRGGSLLVRHVLNWPTELSLPAIFASVGVSVFVGVVFGFYPAWKASKLDPIEALRYE